MATEYEQPAAISLQELVPQQKFTLPTGLTFFPGNSNVMYLLQQDGMIWRLVDDGGEIIVNPFVDLREYYNVVYLPEGLGGCNECGLYSMVFHPNFNQNGYIYISFTTDGANGRPLQTHIKRFRSSDNGVSLAQDNSGKLEETVIFEIQQPANLHNNGQMRFGPDGYLYIGMGDGGYSLDAQNVHNPFGSILRITDEGEPAPGNLVQGGLPELYAIGLRNPWFWSFDRLTGDLWAGDVGHAKIEEVNRIVNGGNYGWPCFEGNSTYIECGSSGPFENPIWDYGRVDGSAVTGGYVYRGRGIESLYGTYLFSDFLSGIIWGLREIPGEAGYERIQLIASGKAVSAFAENNDGELYILDYAEGGIYRLVPRLDHATKRPLPARLSETGCMDMHDVTQPGPQLLPYSINEPLWSDGADKERFFSLPENGQIEVDDQGDFHFPVGTILLKNFRLQGKLIETRLLLNQENSGWSGYSYAWNDDVTEAILLETSEDREFGGQIWHYPSRAECRQCHTSAAGFSLGLEIAQLNRISPNTGQNQLDWFVERNLFSSELGPHQLALKLPGSKDLSASLGERARAFLHSNCSYCHRPGGTSQSNMDLRFGTELIFTNTCGVEPIQGDLGIASALLLAPGVADRSLIWQRISANNENKMPPLARNHVDMESAELIRDWINNMDFCRTIAGPLDGKYALHKDENTILGRTNSLPALVNTDSENKVEWQIKPAIENFYHISLVGDDDLFLHYENLKLSIGPIRPEWWSAHWELIAEEDYFLVRNRWYGHYLRVVNDSVGMAPLSDEGQYKWRIVLNPNHGG